MSDQNRPIKCTCGGEVDILTICYDCGEEVLHGLECAFCGPKSEINKLAKCCECDKETDLEVEPTDAQIEEALIDQGDIILGRYDDLALVDQMEKVTVNHGLCAWCKHYFNRDTGDRCQPVLTDEQFEVTRHDGTSHGCCPTCRNKMVAEAKAKKPTPIAAGTPVKVIAVNDAIVGVQTGDTRNEGRCGVIDSVILGVEDVDYAANFLYEIRFTDDVVHAVPHWMDIESNLTDGNSAYFGSELEQI